MNERNPSTSDVPPSAFAQRLNRRVPTMRSREDVDPELHLLRTMIETTLEGKQRQAAEAARYGVFKAFEHKQPALARRWLVSLRACLHNQPSALLGESIGNALDVLELAIEEAS
jgi:hypothetical protein